MAKAKKTSFDQFDPETRKRMGLPDPSKVDRRTRGGSTPKLAKSKSKPKKSAPKGNRRTRNVRAGKAAERAIKRSTGRGKKR